MLLRKQRSRRILSVAGDHGRAACFIVGLALCVSLWASTTTAQKESPIRISLPGFGPTTRTQPARLPVPGRYQSPIRASLPGHESSNRSVSTIGRSSTVVPQVIPVTPLDVRAFDASVLWSLHCNTRSPDGSAVEAVATRGCPTVKVTTLSADCFGQSISASLMDLPDPSAPLVIPVTRFDVDQFRESIRASLADFLDRPAPVVIPVTRFDANRFRRSIIDSLPAVQPAATSHVIRQTGFDLAVFRKSVIDSLPAVPQMNSSSGISNTGFNGNRFDESIKEVLNQVDANPVPQPVVTEFDVARFDHAISASLAALRYPATATTAPAQAQGKK